jgi:nicotinamidase-related amidase
MASRRQPRPKIALLLIDLINDWRMKDGKVLLRNTLRILPRIIALKRRAARAKIPVIYINDNFGQWRSNFAQVIEHAKLEGPRAAQIAQQLMPTSDDYFVLKPRHSAFYATPLSLLLEELEIEELVLAGVAGDQCVLATAGDALLREFKVRVPADLTVCKSAARRTAIVRHYRDVMDIAVGESRRTRF